MTDKLKFAHACHPQTYSTALEADIDTDMIEAIEMLHARGIKTYASCIGFVAGSDPCKKHTRQYDTPGYVLVDQESYAAFEELLQRTPWVRPDEWRIPNARTDRQAYRWDAHRTAETLAAWLRD